jgi:hypothetical protein
VERPPARGWRAASGLQLVLVSDKLLMLGDLLIHDVGRMTDEQHHHDGERGNPCEFEEAPGVIRDDRADEWRGRRH